jgi:hypothetical protein
VAKSSAAKEKILYEDALTVACDAIERLLV